MDLQRLANGCLCFTAGDEGAEALAAAFAASRGLKKLHIQGNHISSAQQQVVQHVLKTRQYKM